MNVDILYHFLYTCSFFLLELPFIINSLYKNSLNASKIILPYIKGAESIRCILAQVDRHCTSVLTSIWMWSCVKRYWHFISTLMIVRLSSAKSVYTVMRVIHSLRKRLAISSLVLNCRNRTRNRTVPTAVHTRWIIAEVKSENRWESYDVCCIVSFLIASTEVSSKFDEDGEK